MKLGQPAPMEGMGATILCWTDRKPGTITMVFESRKAMAVAVREDLATRIDESQVYEYAPNPNGRETFYRQRSDGSWQELVRNERGVLVQCNGHGLRIGEREKYHDYSF